MTGIPDEHETTRKVLKRFNEASVSVIDTTNSYIPPTNLSISVSEFVILYSPTYILDEVFFASNVLQDTVSIIQCSGLEVYLTKSKSNPKQPHHIKLNKNGKTYWTNFGHEAPLNSFQNSYQL